MATESLSTSGAEIVKPSFGNSTFARVARYSIVRLFTLFITVVIGVYLTILIANMGGYVDEIMRNEIRFNISQEIMMNPANRSLDSETRERLIEGSIAREEERLHLNEPFAIRSVRYLQNALTLNLGRAINMTSDSGSKQVRLILLERLPATLLLAGTADMILFFGSVFLALTLSRKYGSFWDKAIIAMSPTSAAPPWFYGIFFIVFFAAILKVMPFGGLVDSPPPDNTLEYGLSVLKHLALPASAIIISAIFLSIYNWRTTILSSKDMRAEYRDAIAQFGDAVRARYVIG